MEFNESANKIKNFLKGLIKENSDANTISEIASMDKEIDNMIQNHDSIIKEKEETRNKLLEVVQETSFKLKEDPNSHIDGETKSMDEILSSELDNIVKGGK